MSESTSVTPAAAQAPPAQIHPSAIISPGASVGAGSVIHPFVVIESGVQIGERVEIFPGAYIGKPPRAAGNLSRPLSFDKVVRIGGGSVIGPNAVIYYDVELGSNTLIGDGASIREECRIGDDCIISRCVTLNYNVRVGNRTKIMDNTHITGNTVIGDDCFISLCVGTTNDNAIGRLAYDADRVKGPTIENSAAVGAGVTILPGIVIAHGALVGAGSVVTTNVPANAVAMGSPARVVGYLGTAKGSAEKYVPAADASVAASGVPTSMAGVTMHRMKSVDDARGHLTVGEFERDIPFVPMRYFTITDVPDQRIRAEHALRHCAQFLICLRGSCAVVVDDGHSREEIRLDDPTVALYIPPMIWRTLYKFTRGTIVMVFASTYYDPDEYIRDYAQYRKAVQTDG